MTCGAPSSTTCATASASAPACASAATSARRTTIEPGLLHDEAPVDDVAADDADVEALEADAPGGCRGDRRGHRGCRGRGRRGGSRRGAGRRGRARSARRGAAGRGRGGRGRGRHARRRRSGVSRRDSAEAKSAGSSLLELVVIVAVALGMALAIQAFLVKPYRIPSESMVPTLDRRPARPGQPRRHALRRAEGRGHPRVPPAGRRRVGDRRSVRGAAQAGRRVRQADARSART